jgi:pyruvate,water dikinase
MSWWHCCFWSQSCKLCFASLFTDRAIVYRTHHGFDHFQVALSIGIQQMIRSDRGSAGVMFTIDTDTGFPDVALINSSWGLGENVVQGTVSPDEYLVYKPSLLIPDTKPIMKKKLGKKEKTMVLARGPGRSTRNMETTRAKMNRFSLDDDDVIILARWGVIIEQHYSLMNGKPTPMDIEWAKDGETNKLYIVQARPETVQARANAAELVSYVLTQTDLPDPVIEGTSVGQKIVHGEICMIHHVEDLSKFRAGCILVSEITDPDWYVLLSIDSILQLFP